MRRAMVVALVLGLLVGAMIAPAEAGKKKKKKKPPPPATFEADGSLATANPLDFLVGAGVTRNEFVETCSIPVSQGLDGYVIELDGDVKNVLSNVALTGSDLSGTYDLDMYFFSESCSAMGEVSEAGSDEFGMMPPGVTYVLIAAFFGTEVEFNFKAVEDR